MILKGKAWSNEAIYRQRWAAFVDGTIAQQQSNGTEGVGEQIKLRDLMRLEEVLSQIENEQLAPGRGCQVPENSAPAANCAREGSGGACLRGGDR